MPYYHGMNSACFFDTTRLLPGDILHTCCKGAYSAAIRRVIGSKGSHDALFVYHLGQWWVGEIIVGGGRLTPLEKYSKLMAAGKCTTAVLRMPDAQPEDRLAAQKWFIKNILGAPYDMLAIARLGIKYLFGNWSKRAAGWEWAWYCTESVRDAWSKPSLSKNFDVWVKNNPTPRTTEKRLAAGALMDVSAECLTTEGQRYRLRLEGPK